jgi:hypothetical protein
MAKWNDKWLQRYYYQQRAIAQKWAGRVTEAVSIEHRIFILSVVEDALGQAQWAWDLGHLK